MKADRGTYEVALRPGHMNCTHVSPSAVGRVAGRNSKSLISSRVERHFVSISPSVAGANSYREITPGARLG
jgi:hypothetical protein